MHLVFDGIIFHIEHLPQLLSLAFAFHANAKIVQIEFNLRLWQLHPHAHKSNKDFLYQHSKC